MITPAVSVVMCVRNAEAFLDEAIASILGQSLNDLELVVVDDGSADSSGATIARWQRRDRRVRALQSGGAGLVASANLGLGAARAPYIARMDADDIAHPQRLARQLDVLEARRELGVLGTAARLIDRSGAIIGVSQAPMGAEVAARIDGESLLVINPSAVIRREVLSKVGGYRRAFPCGQDHDLWYRVSEHAAIDNLPTALLCYRRHAGQISAKHLLDQIYARALAFEALTARRAGHADPLDRLSGPPAVADLPALFASNAAAQRIVDRVLASVVRNAGLLAGPGYQLLREHLAAASAGGPGARGRAVVRAIATLAAARRVRPAATLAVALAKAALR